MTISSDFNDKVLHVWKRFPDESRLMPAQYPKGHFAYGQKLLMLGMNPAFGANWIQNRISKHHRLGEGNARLAAEEVFAWNRESGGLHIEHLLKIEEDAFENYGVFFNPQRKFAEAVGCLGSCSHLDLFHVRHSDQSRFLTTINAAGELTLFGKAQVDLTLKTICEISPEVVVIANATAAKMAVKYLELEYVGASGTQCILRDLPKTRFFLAGMLSGGRAMDTFSRLRLEDEVRSYLRSNRAI